MSWVRVICLKIDTVRYYYQATLIKLAPDRRAPRIPPHKKLAELRKSRFFDRIHFDSNIFSLTAIITLPSLEVQVLIGIQPHLQYVYSQSNSPATTS